MKKVNCLTVFAIALLLLASCRKIEQLPPEPRIEFRSFKIIDTIEAKLGNKSKAGILKFYFEDGDGDVGNAKANMQDTSAKDLILTIRKKENGVMPPFDSTNSQRPFLFGIPFMEKEGQNKILKGIISTTILYLFYNDSDTVIYDFYIQDRKGNKSNFASTNEIIISKNGTY